MSIEWFVAMGPDYVRQVGEEMRKAGARSPSSPVTARAAERSQLGRVTDPVRLGIHRTRNKNSVPR